MQPIARATTYRLVKVRCARKCLDRDSHGLHSYASSWQSSQSKHVLLLTKEVSHPHFKSLKGCLLWYLCLNPNDNDNPGDWYMDSDTSSHMIGDQGILAKYFPTLLHDSSQVVVGNGSHLPILDTSLTYLRAPNINFLRAFVLHTQL
jgi:hypothetical protein